MTLLQLAERCEAATGRDWQLEQDIAAAAGYGDFQSQPFTSSLDAALTLVPEALNWMLHNRFNGYHAEVGWPHGGNATTPALALCAAALKARGAQGTEAQRATTEEQGVVHDGPVRDSECAQTLSGGGK